MKEVLSKSRFIAVLVFLVLVFRLFVRIFMLTDNYISEYSFVMLETGIHMFLYILFLLYIRMLQRVVSASSPLGRLLKFGLICYIFFVLTELASLRLAGTDFDWDFATLHTMGETISLTLYLIASTALMVFYFLLARRMPKCSARTAAYFVAASQTVLYFLMQKIDVIFNVEQYGGKVSILFVADDLVCYALMIWFLLTIPRIPLKSTYA